MATSFTSSGIAWEVVMQAQMEIQIFVVAFLTYALFRVNKRAPANNGMLAKKVHSLSCPEEAEDAHAQPDAMKVTVRGPNCQRGSEALYRNSVIKALRAGNPQEAHKSIELMRKAGHSPSRSMLNELLDIMIKSGSDDVWGVVDLMQTCGVKPNRITCSILLKNMNPNLKDSGIARILETLTEMDDDFDEVLVNSVVEACMRVGRADLLVQQLRCDKFLKVQLNNSWTYANIIRAYSSVGDSEGVSQTWRALRKAVPVPSKVAIAYMVEALSTNGDPDAGYDLIQEMLADAQTKNLVTAVTYGSLLKGYSHHKRFDRVLSTYQEMRKQEVKLTLVTYNTIMDACARCGEMTHIPCVLNDMAEQGVEPNIITYSIIVKAYCQENRLEEALQVWKSMVETTHFKPDEAMYNTVLAGCARKGEYERGMEIFSQMQQAGVRPSNVTLSVLVKLAKRRRLLDKAFDLCKELSQKYKIRLNVHVFNNLIMACLESDDTQRAFSVLGQMIAEGVRLDARTYSLLLPACISSLQWQDAASLTRLAYGIRGRAPVSCSGLDCANESVIRLCKVQGGLPSSLIADILDNIGGKRGDASLALALIQDLNGVQGLKIPTEVKARILSLQAH